MAKRSTINDVARSAGVSPATVDRVLNGRLKVREDTARRVLDAAHRVGYHAAALIEQRMRPELEDRRFGFVLLKQRQAFFQNFAAEIEDAVRAAPNVRGSADIRFATSQSPADIVAEMEALAETCDVLAISAITHHTVTDAVIRIQAAGTPVFALLNDFAQGERRSYVGMNNLKVGRIAGWMVGTAARQPGKLAVFIGGNRWHGHELRETGFRSQFREFAPEFTVIDTLVNLETRQLTYEATLDLLDRHQDLRGIYIAGGGMEGAIAALREVREPGEIALVVNELTPESRAALSERYLALVIATPLRRLCRDLIRLMVDAADADPSEISGQYFLQPDLYLPESV